jgi:hypothetical protein
MGHTEYSVRTIQGAQRLPAFGEPREPRRRIDTLDSRKQIQPIERLERFAYDPAA